LSDRQRERAGRNGAVFAVQIQPELVDHPAEQAGRAQHLDLGLHGGDIDGEAAQHVRRVGDPRLAGVEHDQGGGAVLRCQLHQDQDCQSADERRHPDEMPLAPIEEAQDLPRVGTQARRRAAARFGKTVGRRGHAGHARCRLCWNRRIGCHVDRA
jgi:hypothetical protein